MQYNIKNIIITIGFLVILILTFVINIISKDKAISISERRKLTQLPEITLQNIKSADVAKKFDKYTTDQFIARDFFRKVKSFVSINILNQKDNNNLFEKDGAIYKMDYPLNESNVQMSLKKINNVYNKYLNKMDVYYAIIPDKNYYLTDDEHLKLDYDELLQMAKNELKQMKNIDIAKSLTLTDYYRTDLHLKQENLNNVVSLIQSSMGVMDNLNATYEINEVGDFYGAYYGQLGVKVYPDTLYILSNETIKNCTTYNYETQKVGKIYDMSQTADKYDIYLSGATALITIQNPNVSNKRELLLFRDSFGSSIAPLLIENYSKITLIDLRYMSSQLLDKYIEFKNQDVLFLYSALVLNQNILK